MNLTVWWFGFFCGGFATTLVIGAAFRINRYLRLYDEPAPESRHPGPQRRAQLIDQEDPKWN